jgi:cobalt-zinc-cadmium efflux system outer membrane protein
VRLAVEHDPQLQMAVARLRGALADARQARLLPNPVLSVVFRYPEGGGKPVVEAGLAADLVSLLTRPRRVGAADARTRAAAADVMKAAIDAVAGVQERYVAVQALEARLAVLRERRALVGRLAEIARSRLEAGEGGRVDVTTLEVEGAALEVDVIDRAGELRDERLALARLVGKPSDAADWRVEPWVEGGGKVATERAWVAAALAARPELQARRWELAALGDDMAVARLAVFDGAGFGVNAERDAGSWSAGPAASSVPLPIFDWGQARREKVSARVAEARHGLTQAGREVIEEVRRAYAGLASARAAVDKVRGDVVPLQKRRREQVEAAYRVGGADVTAVLVAEQQSQEVRERLVEFEARVRVAVVRLERAVGGPGTAAVIGGPTTRRAGVSGGAVRNSEHAKRPEQL